MPGYWVTCELDRYASEAPMSTTPAAASLTPLPEPPAAGMIDTFEYFELYAGAHSSNSGYISELPSS